VAGFKQFLLRTNALALAVAVIIGIALGNVVNSLVNDIIMPPIGKLLGNVDFSALKVSLGGAAADGTEVAIRWGTFLNSVISFVIVALVVYSISKMLIKDEAPAGPSDEVVLLTEIRDALKAR
jgi:large conductance mechanosensitive channel